MSNYLKHSPADVIARLITSLNGGVEPSSGNLTTPWQTFATKEPALPDDCITVYDTQGVSRARTMKTGELLTGYGIQVRVRSEIETEGWIKADQLRILLAEAVYQIRVDLTDPVAASYLVWSLDEIKDVIALGTNVPNDKRSLFTLNMLATITMY